MPKQSLSDRIFKTTMWICGIVAGIYILIACHYLRRAYIADQFVIPTHSMTPTLIPGDRVIVNKLIFGARIYEEFNFFDNAPLKSYRTRGFRGIEHNDIVVFNIPKHEGKIQFRINKVFAKRCIALPGDSISIQNGYFRNNNYTGALGHIPSQRELASTPTQTLSKVIKRAMPFDKSYNWTIKNFGAMYIPRRGDVLQINNKNYKLYKSAIEYETNQKVSIKNGIVMLGEKQITHHIFKDSYYFMCGDNVLNSSDSRYWGLAPEEFIIGVASHITYSKDKYTGEFRWNRTMKKL